MTNKQFMKQFEAIKRRIEKDRDDLRDLVYEANDILETNESAVEYMNDAAEELSKLL